MFEEVLSFVNDNIDFISLLITVLCAAIAIYELRLSAKSTRAGYVNELLNRITENEDIQSFLLHVDYENDWYTDKFHHGDDDERVIAQKADKTFFTFNYICYLYKEKMLNKKEMEIFNYYIDVLASDDEVGCYFLDLYQYTLFKDERFPFGYFLDFCIKKGYIPSAIKDKNYFFEVMKYESDKNSGKDSKFPNEIKNVYEKYGKKLFIKPSVNRCENCKYYNAKDKICYKKKGNYKEYEFMTVGSYCELFLYKG